MIFLALAVGIPICFIVLVNYFIIGSSLVRNQLLVTVLHGFTLCNFFAFAHSIILTLFAHAQAQPQICMLIFFFNIFYRLFCTPLIKCPWCKLSWIFGLNWIFKRYFVSKRLMCIILYHSYIIWYKSCQSLSYLTIRGYCQFGDKGTSNLHNFTLAAQACIPMISALLVDIKNQRLLRKASGI